MENNINPQDLDAFRAEQRMIIYEGVQALFNLHKVAGTSDTLMAKIRGLDAINDDDRVELLESLLTRALDPEMAEAFAKLPEEEQIALRKAAA